jgi:hypothetical protein
MFKDFNTDYEYLRPPIDILGLEKQQYWFQTEKGNTDRHIWYDRSDWTTNEQEELQYWKNTLAENKIKLTHWWNDEEIIRYMWTSGLGRDPDAKFSDGRMRLEWIQMYDTWLNEELNYDLTNDVRNILISGDVTILGRDKYYR